MVVRDNGEDTTRAFGSIYHEGWAMEGTLIVECEKGDGALSNFFRRIYLMAISALLLHSITWDKVIILIICNGSVATACTETSNILILVYNICV